MDDQQETTRAEKSDTSNNLEQLEFLQFLKSLDEVPHEIGNVSIDGDDAVDAADAVDAVSELESQQVTPQVNYSQPNELVLDPDLAIPHITISMPEGQFLGSEQLIPEINISFSNLPPAPVAVAAPAAAPLAAQILPISERARAELQQEYLMLQKHHFVHKLYLATSSQQLGFLTWSGNGQQLQLDYIGLQEHLSGTQSLFGSHNVQQFTRHILDMGFERVRRQQSELLEKRPQLYYQSKNFRAGQPQLLLLLPTPKWKHSQINFSLPKNPLVVDSASRTLNPQSPLQLARCRLQMLLQYHNDVRLLQQQEPSAEQLLPRRGRISSGRQPSQVLQPSLATKHVNPRDSVLQFEVGHVPEYAGFYGHAEPALISEFFAEYLPRYGSRISGYKDIVVDASKANSFQQNLPIGIVYSEDEEDFDEQECPVLEMKENSPELVTNSIPEDIELEQVMQELCGIVPEAEERLDKKEMTPSMPKLKRKKLTRKCASFENETEHDSAQEETAEDLVQSVPEPATPIKDVQKSKAEKDNSKETSKENSSSKSKEDADKDVKGQSPKREIKRRRYDLRNSKSKRTN